MTTTIILPVPKDFDYADLRKANIRYWCERNCAGKVTIEPLVEKGMTHKTKIRAVCELEIDATLLALKWT